MEDNSELRYLTLQLMKIAIKTKKPFKVIARQYVRNMYTLYKILQKEDAKYR
jgi:hypothetical protein